MMYKLDRGNMAYNFCSLLNFNIYYEQPRQTGKTTAVIIRNLYLYNFGTKNSKFAFLHKGADGSKDNLSMLKAIRECLPKYLQLTERPMPNGKVDRGKNNVTGISNPFNNNQIMTFASATNKAKAASLLRGKTLPLIWWDEHAFSLWNDVIYMNGAPAFKMASSIARQNGAPYGITMTTTPGFMTSPEGKEGYEMKESATNFSESWYDKSYNEVMTIINANTKSNYVYIRYDYQQLGYPESWFQEVSRLLKNSWPDIRREILLEWSAGVDNSPFRADDLDAISNLIVKQPLNVQYLLGKYPFETYLQADTRTYPPIIGVDVAAGYKQDSSTITVIDSATTRVLGCLNCNYISTLDLSRCIEYIVKNWMPNAIVNVERNGVGSSVVANLIKMGLKKNLYFEMKDKIVEERQDGVHAYKQKVRVREFGLNSTKDVRRVLIDLLIDRVEHHKDKIISPIIYNELLGMEIKRNGKVEHSDSTHDDQVFSMLMALYVWYYGTDLAERYGIRKTSIRTDDDIDEVEDYLNDGSVEIIDQFNEDPILDQDIKMDLDAAIKAGGIPIQQYLEEVREKEKKQFENLVRTPLGERAFRQKYNIPANVPISNFIGEPGAFQVPDSIFFDFYDNRKVINYSPLGDDRIRRYIGAVPEAHRWELEDEEYSYNDHFNF